MTVKPLERCLVWCAVMAALICLFRFRAPPDDPSAHDADRKITVLTEHGPVVMTLAEYLPGAVAAEMPVSFGAEALKAQAVAIRSYALAAPRHDSADICTDSSCCLAYRDDAGLEALWGGGELEKNLGIVSAAAAETDGQVLSYDGRIIQAVFHASSAGSTEDSASVWSPIPYLVSVSSPESAASVPELMSYARFTDEELAALLELPEGASAYIPPSGLTRDDAGRVSAMNVGGVVITGQQARTALGLKSTDFTVSRDGDGYLFTVAGHGHGVGMSQYGAKLLAEQGWTYDRILSHYYPGAALIVP